MNITRAYLENKADRLTDIRFYSLLTEIEGG